MTEINPVDLSPLKYKVVFECSHSKIMSDYELHHPPIDSLYSPSSMQNEKGYLCEACERREPSACSISPFQRVKYAEKLSPLDRRRL
jgi:hypothetical protein